MKIAVCFLSTNKNHFNYDLLLQQTKESKLHEIDIYHYINDYNNIPHYLLVNNNEIYFSFDVLKNKFNYNNYLYKEKSIDDKYNIAGNQFLCLLDLYVNNKNEYDFFLFWENDIVFFNKNNNFFDIIDFNCEALLLNNNFEKNINEWFWIKYCNYYFNEHLDFKNALLQLYGFNKLSLEKFIDFINDKNYAHFELLIPTFVMNKLNNINFISSFFNIKTEYYEISIDNINNKIDILHPVKTIEKYNNYKNIINNE